MSWPGGRAALQRQQRLATFELREASGGHGSRHSLHRPANPARATDVAARERLT